MYKEFGISEEIEVLANECEKEIEEELKKVDEVHTANSIKVLNAFHNNNLSEMHFAGTTGYGYNDIGRDVIEKIFAEVLGAEDSLVRNQFISGTHAITVALFAILRPGDTLLAISRKTI